MGSRRLSERIRWQNDVEKERIGHDNTLVGRGWCVHDVSIPWGVRVGGTTRLGVAIASYSTGTG